MFAPPYYQSAYYDTRTPHRSPYGPSAAYSSSRYIPTYNTYPGTHTRHASYDSPSKDPHVTYVRLDSQKTSKPSKKTSAPKKERISVRVVEDPYVYEYRSPKGTPPPPYDHHYTSPATHIYEKKPDPPIYKTRARARSTPQKSTPKQAEQPAQKASRQTSTKTRKTAATKATRSATAKDAARNGIPDGYSLKNWDPDEEPILLLGSVFDSNTLGKWIYDWTVFHHGAGSPMADHAGELWLALIELASKLKRAEECVPRIRRRSKRAIVDDYLDQGQDLFCRLDEILRTCEDYMWAAARRENGGRKTKSLGASSGCAFVDAIFGRDCELETTERLMADTRFWTHRFNTLCEPILRHPKD